MTLDVYGHLLPSMHSEVAELIGDLVMPVAVQINQDADKLVDYNCSRLQQKLYIRTITFAIPPIYIRILRKSP